MPDHDQRVIDALAYIDNADPTTIPTVNPDTGPADHEVVDQEPGFEEVEVLPAASDTSLADPTVMEVA